MGQCSGCYFVDWQFEAPGERIQKSRVVLVFVKTEHERGEEIQTQSNIYNINLVIIQSQAYVFLP